MNPAHSIDHSKPKSLSGYLEAMSRAIFTAGISWTVVDSKWDGIKDAFRGFDVEKVAALSPEEIERLENDPRVIRNHKKIEAIVDDAAMMLKLDRESGGFAKYLASRGDLEARVDDLRRNFRFMGPSTAHIFLALVGDKDATWGRMHDMAGKSHQAH